MYEDKLSPDQRLRLECIAQAIMSMGAPAGRSVGDEAIVARAKKFEQFLRGDES